MSIRSAELAEEHLPTILSHGTLYECARAYLLMAKCKVASSAKDAKLSTKERRVHIFTAIKYLKLSLQGFKTMGSFHRSKDVLYLMARLYHFLDLFGERNQTAAEFKRLDEQYPTNTTCQLANML